MKGHIFYALAVILIPIATAYPDGTEMDAGTASAAHGKDPDVAHIADVIGDPVIPQEELHLTKQELAAAHVDAAVAAKVEEADHHDEELEHELAAEEQKEEEQEKKDEADRIKEEADKKIAAAEKAKHKKEREAHHKQFLTHHMDKLKKLVSLIKERIVRHKKAMAHES